MGGFGMPDPLLANKGGDWEAGYRACLQVWATALPAVPAQHGSHTMLEGCRRVLCLHLQACGACHLLLPLQQRDDCLHKL